jgi:hypothetical protein
MTVRPNGCASAGCAARRHAIIYEAPNVTCDAAGCASIRQRRDPARRFEAFTQLGAGAVAALALEEAGCRRQLTILPTTDRAVAEQRLDGVIDLVIRAAARN